MLRARPTSSATLSGQTSFMSSAFSTMRPRRSSGTCKVSMVLGPTGAEQEKDGEGPSARQRVSLLVRHDDGAVIHLAIARRLQAFQQLAVDLRQRTIRTQQDN